MLKGLRPTHQPQERTSRHCLLWKEQLLKLPSSLRKILSLCLLCHQHPPVQEENQFLQRRPPGHGMMWQLSINLPYEPGGKPQ